jgi:signal transduction histidine kinase
MPVFPSSRRSPPALRFPSPRSPLRPSERRALGAELHDRLCQELSGLGLLSAALARSLPAGTLGRKEAAALARGYARAGRIANELVAGLLPVPVADLPHALRTLAARLGRQSGAACSCSISGRNLPVEGETAAQLFRIAQEAGRNALRHGQPLRIRIALALRADGRNELRIRDDGRGMGTRAGRKGFGLAIMRFRAHLIGGELEVESVSGSGCTITCVWPAGGGRS